jgi:transmembrane sensor
MDVSERRARATEEAAHWWERLGTKPPAEVSEVDRQEFTQWLRESPLHVAELLHVAHVHDALVGFKLWADIPLQTQHEEGNVTDLPSSCGVLQNATGGEQIRKNQRRTRSLVAASAAALAIVVGWIAVRSVGTTVATDRAERREVVLTDGSVVSLEPETTLRVELGKRQRRVLLTQGRALFHVAKDSTRPFIVHAGKTDVRAVGTIFGVEQKNQSIIVTVSEGKVAVVPTADLRSVTPSSNSPLFAPRENTQVSVRDGAANHDDVGVPTEKGARVSAGSTNAMASGEPGEVFLTADQQITVPKSGAASSIDKVDANRALAWSEGRLVFDSTPLSEVAEEFNRYNRVRLRIRGEALRHRTISGVFKASDPQTLIDFIGAGARVVVTRRDSQEILISPEP